MSISSSVVVVVAATVKADDVCSRLLLMILGTCRERTDFSLQEERAPVAGVVGLP